MMSYAQMPKLSVRKLILLILAVYLSCVGCASNDAYPENWQPVVAGGTECPDISGTYENSGLGTNTGIPREFELSEILLGDLQTNDETISIAQPEKGKIQISTHRGDQSPEPHTLSREDDDFTCEDGKIWVTLAKSFDVDFGAAGGEITKMGFAKAEDDSLVGEERYVLAGVMVVVPVRFSEKSFIRWKAGNKQLDVDGRTRIDVPIHRGRGIDERRLDDVDACALYVYTMDNSVSARIFIDTTQYADVTLAGPEYGQLSLKDGAYRIAATFSDGSVGEFDITCSYSTWIGGRRYTKHFMQLYRTPEGKHGATKQSAGTAIRDMKRGVLSADNRLQVDIPIGSRSDLKKDELRVSGGCLAYFFVSDRAISARLYINTNQFSDLELTKSDYAKLTLDQDVNSITAVFDDGTTDNIDFTCQIPKSINVAMFYGGSTGNNKLALQPGGLGIRRITTEQ